MADIALTAAQIAPVHPLQAIVYSGIAASAITKGQPLYQVVATGKMAAADANAANLQQVRGIALNAASAGDTVDYLQTGHMYGYTLTSQSFDDPIFLSDTAGSLADAAGTLEVPVGVVVALPQGDGSLTKVILFDIRIGADWA